MEIFAYIIADLFSLGADVYFWRDRRKSGLELSIIGVSFLVVGVGSGIVFLWNVIMQGKEFAADYLPYLIFSVLFSGAFAAWVKFGRQK